jgi:uncharacterized protein YlxW (UPF0749 family)
MNYIKRLQEDSQEKQNRIQELEDKIAEVLRYVNSDKFKVEGELQFYVHIMDINLRLT